MSYIDGLSDRDLSKSQLASLRRLEKKATITMAMEMDDAMAAALEQIYQAIVELRGAVAGLPAPVVNVPEFPSLPAPVVHVEPPDLSAIVTAVTGLKPGADAEDIARAIAGVIAPSQPASESGAEALSSVAAALEKLDFRLKGLGTQAYGGGSVSLLPNQSVGISGTVDTELPAASVLADDMANPTVPGVSAHLVGFDGTTWDRIKSVTDGGDAQASATVGNLRARVSMMLYNGTTWDRVRGDTANGLDVDVTRLPGAATPTQSSVAGSASSVTLLAANANRMGATIYNDSTALLRVKLGATASATSFSVVLAALDANGIGGYYEVPYGYTGIIDGIWASAAGNARITELT